MSQEFVDSSLVEDIITFRCPRFNELPSIDLYMDQVIQVITETLAPLSSPDEEKIITPSMVNNYVKQKVVSAPKNKQYSKNHMVYLMVVCILKKYLSIAEICQLILLQINSYPIEASYDYFCSELENALNFTFQGKTDEVMPDISTKRTLQTTLVRSTVLAYANKLYIQKLLQFEKEKIVP